MAQVEGRAATLRILEWVEAFATDEAHASAMWHLLEGGYQADETDAEADYAVTRWEDAGEPWPSEALRIFAYLVPVLEAPPIDVVDVRDEWAQRYGGDPYAVAEFGA